MWLKDWRRKGVGLLLAIVTTGCGLQTPRFPGSSVDEARRLVDRGTMALRVGDLDTAQAAFEVALQSAPLTSAIDGLGCVAFLRGEYATAGELFKRAYAQQPGYAAALFNLAMVYEVQGQSEEAKLLYERGLSISPRDARGRANYGALLADQARAQRGSAKRARHELMRAQVLAGTGLVSRNIETLDESL